LKELRKSPREYHWFRKEELHFELRNEGEYKTGSDPGPSRSKRASVTQKGRGSREKRGKVGLCSRIVNSMAKKKIRRCNPTLTSRNREQREPAGGVGMVHLGSGRGGRK